MGQQTSPRAVTIVFMGDFITAGQYVDPELRWTSLVDNALVVDYLSTPVNFHILKRGVSGETTRQGLERFPADLQQYRPDIETLQFGSTTATAGLATPACRGCRNRPTGPICSR